MSRLVTRNPFTRLADLPEQVQALVQEELDKVARDNKRIYLYQEKLIKKLKAEIRKLQSDK